MKNLIFIFLSFFLFSCVLQAQTEITYIDSAGVITATIKETRVIERLSFTNYTGVTFDDREKAILFQGGVVLRSTQKMTQLFPPMFSEVVQGFSIQNGNVEQSVLKESPPVMSWYYLIFCMVLPFGFLLLSSISIPKEKTRYLLFVYILAAAVGVAVDAAFIIASCVTSYVFRYLWLKKKERKELTQATV